MTDRTAFNHETTASEAIEGIDLSGKRALVTGGASGLGTETARALASAGAHVVIAARDPAKGEAAKAEIAEATGSSKVDVIELDLASLEAIRASAKEFRQRYDRLDLLVNNAGVMASPLGRTADGFEMQFGTNHLSHFLLTNLLVAQLADSAPSRIVNLSSRGHFRTPVIFEDPNYATREYDKWEAYGNSKTANVLFTVGLEKRLAAKGVHSFAVHPGGIVTNLGRHLDDADVQMLMENMKKAAEASDKGGSPLKSIPQGAATSVYAATAPELEGKGGVYLEDCQIAAIDDESISGGVRSYALDPDAAEKLWHLSEELVGERFPW